MASLQTEAGAHVDRHGGGRHRRTSRGGRSKSREPGFSKHTRSRVGTEPRSASRATRRESTRTFSRISRVFTSAFRCRTRSSSSDASSNRKTRRSRSAARSSVAEGSRSSRAPAQWKPGSKSLAVAKEVKAGGASLLRGGAFKPRTSPYAFQGLKQKGLDLLEEARQITGLPVVTEVKDTHTLEAVAKTADVLQIGARNMQNFSLLEAAGSTPKPVLLKRGLAATVKEWLMAAEYIVASGNPPRHPVRARSPHLRDRDKKHPRPWHPARTTRDDASPHHRRSIARHRSGKERRAARSRRARRRRRRRHGRSAPRTSPRPLRWPASAHLRHVLHHDGTNSARSPPHSTAHSTPCPRPISN